MTDRDDLSGRRRGEFVLRERLDEGGFGTVYRCEQPTLGREAVVKVLHRGLRGHDVQLQRFLREAQLASRLDHPHAAHVYAFGAEEADGLLWIGSNWRCVPKHWLIPMTKAHMPLVVTPEPQDRSLDRCQLSMLNFEQVDCRDFAG